MGKREEIEKQQEMRKKSVKYSYKYTFFNSLFTGPAANFNEAFGSFLGLTNFQFTLLLALPQLFGSFFQLSVFRVLRLFGSRKKMNVFFTVFQAMIWVPVIFIAFFQNSYSGWYYIGLIVLYYCITLMINPIWNSWVMDIVIPEKKGDFYGNINSIIGSVGFISFLAGGIILRSSKMFFGNELLGFTVLFIIGSLSNLVAAFFLSRKYEPSYSIVQPRTSLKKFLEGMKKDSQGRIVLYLSLMSFSVYLSAPYFTLYMLRTLKFNYFQFAVLTVLVILPKILFGRKIGPLIDRFGPKKFLKVASSLIALTPMLWLVNNSFAYLLFVQFYAGLAYGMYEVAALTMLMNYTNASNRISLMSYYNFFNGFFILLGALLSNLAVIYGPLSVGYLNAFLASGIFRMLVIFIKFPKVSEKIDYISTNYRKLSTEIFVSFIGSPKLSTKMIAARDIISVRLSNNRKVDTIPRRKEFKVLNIKGDSKKHVANKNFRYNVYMCKKCNAEFRKHIETKTKLKCPFCDSARLYILRKE